MKVSLVWTQQKLAHPPLLRILPLSFPRRHCCKNSPLIASRVRQSMQQIFIIIWDEFEKNDLHFVSFSLVPNKYRSDSKKLSYWASFHIGSLRWWCKNPTWHKICNSFKQHSRNGSIVKIPKVTVRCFLLAFTQWKHSSWTPPQKLII